MTEFEKAIILDHLLCDRFMDKSARQVHAILLAEDIYLCSVSTMYRLLRKNGQVIERRNQARHKKHEIPVLTATGPNQIYSWDITAILGTTKGVKFYLYLVLDIYSRCIVGWSAADKQCKYLAENLMRETFEKQNIVPGMLTLHSDNGSPMVAKNMCMMMQDLGIARSNSRPNVSNDNAHVESVFKSIKYWHDYPGRFGSIEGVREYFREFTNKYNKEHRHSGICMLTPEIVHMGRGNEELARQHETKLKHFVINPRRYRGRAPKLEELPKEVYINKVAQAVELNIAA